MLGSTGKDAGQMHGQQTSSVLLENIVIMKILILMLHQLDQHYTMYVCVLPGGVHASTEDCTRTERLFEGIGIFLSLYFDKAACTASVWRSVGTQIVATLDETRWKLP